MKILSPAKSCAVVVYRKRIKNADGHRYFLNKLFHALTKV